MELSGDSQGGRPPVVIIGAGHAGLSVSYHLKALGIEHVLLERARVGETWREGRWDSFTLVTPNWMNQLPGMPYDGPDPDGFLPLAEVVSYLERYVEQNALPVRTGVLVKSVDHAPDGTSFLVQTEAETLLCPAVVVASGSFQRPRIPEWSQELPAHMLQLGATAYRNPAQLPDGGVLVVGSGQSGAQIAEELNHAGRDVWLSVGSAGRMPRRYRGRDSSWWLVRCDPWTGSDTVPRLHMPVELLPHPSARFAANPHASGKDGGHTLNLHRFAKDGVHLTGRLIGVADGELSFAADLPDNLARADRFASDFRVGVDRYIAATGLDAPAADSSNSDDYDGLDGYDQQPPTSLDPVAAGISTIIWAGGFTHDFGWVRPAPLDEYGYPVQSRGATSVPHLFFAGLHFLTSAKSDLFYGVGDDAAHVASLVAEDLGVTDRR